MSTPRRVKYRVSRSYSERMYKEDTNGVYRKLTDDNINDNQIRQEKFDNRNRPLSYAFGSQSFRETGDRDLDGKGQSLILLKQARSRHSLNLPRSFDLDIDLNANASDNPDDKNTNNNELTPDTDGVKITTSEKISPTDITRPDSVTDIVNTTCSKATETKRRDSSSSDSSTSSDDSKKLKSAAPKRHVNENVKRPSRTSWSSAIRSPAKRSLGSTGSYESQSSGPTSMHDQSFDSLEFREPTLIYSTFDPLISLTFETPRKKESRRHTESDEDIFEFQSLPRPRVALKATVPALSPRIKRESTEEYRNKEDNESVASERKFQEILDDFDDKCDLECDHHFIDQQIDEENIDFDEPIVNDLGSKYVFDIEQQIVLDEKVTPLPDSPPVAGDFEIPASEDRLPNVSEFVSDITISDSFVVEPPTVNGVGIGDVVVQTSSIENCHINELHLDQENNFVSVPTLNTESSDLVAQSVDGVALPDLYDDAAQIKDEPDGQLSILDIDLPSVLDSNLPYELDIGTLDFDRKGLPTTDSIISPTNHLDVEILPRRPSGESVEFIPPLPSSEPPTGLIDGVQGSDNDLINVTESVLNHSVHFDSDSESSVCQCDQARDTSSPETDVSAKITSKEYNMADHEELPVMEIAYYGPIYAKDNTLILPTDLLPRRDSIGSTGSHDKDTDPSSVSNESLDDNDRDNRRRESYRSSLSASSCEYHLPSGIITTKTESEYLPHDTSQPPSQSDVSHYHSMSSASSENKEADTTTSGEVIFEWKFSSSKNNQEISDPHHESTMSSSTYSSAPSYKDEGNHSSKKIPEQGLSNNGAIIVSDPPSLPRVPVPIPRQQVSQNRDNDGHAESHTRSSSKSSSSSSSTNRSIDSQPENLPENNLPINEDAMNVTEVCTNHAEIRPVVTILNNGEDKNRSPGKQNNRTSNDSEKLSESDDDLKARPKFPAKHTAEKEQLHFSEPIASSSPKTSRMKPPKSADHRETSENLEHAIADTGTETADTESQPRHRGHFVVVAIDFGTTYSGYAFSFTSDPDGIHMMRKWEGGDPGVINQKTPTTVLLTPEGLFHSFGFSARDFYHDLDKEEAKKWLYFDKFKMILHNTAELSRDTLLQASNGKLCPAISVFAYALQFFKDHALQELSDQSGTKIINEDVRWVISVPAIWKASAKQFMRQAAYEAGLISPDCPDQLVIALEPEAASIYCRKLRIHQLVPDVVIERPLQSPSRSSPEPMNMSPACEEVITGTRYMVVDCGGGTVDITVHEVNTGGKLTELYRASGGPYGSIGVDVEFEKLLCSIFGKEFIEQYKQKRPVGWVDLMVAFESRKRSSSPDKVTSLNVALPFSFIDYFKKHKSGHIDLVIKKHADKGVQWSSQGMLRLTPGAMKLLFVPTLDRIKQAIGDVLNNPHTRGLKYLFLVGGFAESRILQHEIRKEFSSLLKVIIPQGTGLTILKGAVLFGLDPTVVNVRKSRHTFGVGVLNKYRADKHPHEKHVVKDGKEWCTDVFDKYVEVDQPIAVGDVVLRSYMPVKSDQKYSQINIYSTENRDVNFITDPGVQKCGTLELELLSDNTEEVPDKREIQTRMQFGETEIKVSALDVTSGTIVQAKIDFLNR
ncbi:hypothetical protein FSP39_006636 [Pinctada imbricata]|uniref:Heat shock 70 kDa protein 12A n=1 Tax=Pinctada imbricata TaxID=66713 RepID=A0AA88XZG8_PINIB|nr:hypothetical protein FSP39_006636 [Pinctada imbricata]